MWLNFIVVNRIFKFLIKFFIFATLIFVLWIWIGVYYQNLVLAISRPILLLMGYSELQISALRLSDAYLVNFNLVPFLALIASLDIEMKRRIKLFIIGFIIMLFIHSMDLIAHFPAFFNLSEIAIIIVYSLPILNFGFPFLIWVLWMIEPERREKD